MSKRRRKQESLDYHKSGRPGKIEVVPTKNHSSQRDLSLAYSPGVAEPCIKISEKKDDVYEYTAKSNLVAVITNGTAVLGLGDIGPEASKPVMEGKGLLFKIFADIDVFDIEVDASDVDKFVDVVKSISPTFGGINLEDIKAPECFEIEKRLKDELDIPIMHDDQHGTAIISAAALLNALELAHKKIADIQIVINGAGAAAMSCARLYLSLGAKKSNIIMLDSKGVINNRRKNLSDEKVFFATNKEITTIKEAISGADFFLGLSSGNVVSKDMIRSMADNPIVFALANPDPEISYNDAISARKDIIMATGRSDHPNQVNNVLGFPYIFRGALDVRATCINEAMKLAAVRSIAELTKEVVPDTVNLAYGEKVITFGPEYIIPKPLDNRLISVVAPAVAKAAIESGVSQIQISDFEAYAQELNKRLGLDNKLVRRITTRAKRNPKRVVFAESENYKILKAAQEVKDEGIAIPILLGRESKIRQLIKDNALDLDDVKIIDPKSNEQAITRNQFGDVLFEKRKRKGMTLNEAQKLMRERNYFGSMMVDQDMADAFISGISRNYPITLRPALQIIGMEDGVDRVAGMFILNTKKGTLFLADTTININPSSHELANIAMLTAKTVRRFNVVPRIALLSYSNFGSSLNSNVFKITEALKIIKETEPNLVVDGEIQADFALNKEKREQIFPFSDLKQNANTLIFPNLESGNIAYKLMQEFDDVEAIGPILIGMKKPVHILQLGCSVREIVNMVTIAVIDAQTKRK
ncbi:MAG: NADP-dependent malic enzyme [Flavobacteriales bacterium]|nr:NADP-dependent malic enzyme [Flavobacteriales bacterium]|tara:strand:- start:1909 stop:4179 length:2271 start_codon:yes stop_codon:yes gene_type:complete